jgi:hypothetical protein
MIDQFLKAKHWQIFSITIGAPLLLQMAFGVYLVLHFGAADDPSEEAIFNSFKVVFALMFVFIAFILGYFWSIGYGLQKLVPEDLKSNLKFFLLSLVLPYIYFLIYQLVFLEAFMSGNFDMRILSIIAPFQIVAMAGVLYSIYFMAKTFKTAEVQKKVTFNDFAGEFFMLLFFPIGIWIIQPRINRMVESSKS